VALQERTCKKCGHHWEVWKIFIKDLPKRPACPKCGSRATKVEIWGHGKPTPPPVHYKGSGWTPKSGAAKDLRDVKGMDDPVLAAAMED